MEQLNQEFIALLHHSQHDFNDLEKYPGTIYGIWANYTLAYLNQEWFCFAKENKGEPLISDKWGLGRSVLDCVSGEIRELYETKFNQCLDSKIVWSHEYECSTDTIYRIFHQMVYPLGNREGLLIVNSLVVERPHDLKHRLAKVTEQSNYLDDNGFISQCAYCRRVKNQLETGRWDWVVEWVKKCPENTSHTYCPTCFSHNFHLSASTKSR